MMGLFFDTVNTLFGYLFYPFSGLDPAWGMIWISFLAGIVMLIIFRFTSDQKGIKKAKSRVNAYILEMRLYNHNLGKMLAALGKTFLSNFIYLRYMVVPIIFIIVPVVIILIQLGYRYENRPLQPGEAAIVKAVLRPGSPVAGTGVTLLAPEDIAVETPPLRIPALHEIDWRVHAKKEGVYQLEFTVGDKRYGKIFHAENGLPALGAARVGSAFSAYLLNHAEPGLPDDSVFSSLEIIYPSRTLNIMGVELHWVVWFFLLSLVFSFAFKNVFRVVL